MPFTPLHMGPGALVKAAAGRHFSLTMFGLSQVAIDLEPLVRILRGDGVLHGFSHTYVGATLIAAVCVAAGRPVCQWLLDRGWPESSLPFLHWLRGPAVITWPSAMAGAFVGTWSHVFLDSIMHGDIEPLFPFSRSNSLQLVISIETLHLLCLLAGALALLLLYAVFAFQRSAPSREQG
jgi:hypothetical protein